ncbi:signal peptidase I [Bacillus sp. V3-13]|uniref:signal peptidase I n=1 Tax=Bacillus sp. V3-13 TaxID=2053728 RepID=UPI0015E10BEB|nr:signal peptidase I [Bacillus sp. V3-13]
MKKTLKIISTSFLIFLALAAGAVLFFVFQSKGDVEKAPSLFGFKPLTILSNSMQPALDAGDVILINVNQEPKVNDVITYKHPDGILVTHRAIKKIEQDRKTFFQAKGDNNSIDDQILIPRADILGVEAFIIPNAGYVAKFVSGPIGFALLIGLPLLIFIIIEIFQRLGLIGGKKKEQIS